MECKNCLTQLAEDDNFCKNCGAKIVQQELTFGYLANEATERFFNFENNLLARTIKDMTLQPRTVIDSYINGVRKKHVNVVSYLAFALTLSGIQIFLMRKVFPANMDVTWMNQQNNPMLEDMSFMDNIWEFQSIFYVFMMPLYALLAKVIFFNYKKYTYLHHLVISTYTQAHLSILLFLPAIIALIFDVNFLKMTYFFSMPIMVIFNAYVYKRLYQINLKKIILKTFLFMFMFGVIYIGFMMLFFIYLFISGKINFEEFLEAERAKQAVSYMASSVINWTS